MPTRLCRFLMLCTTRSASCSRHVSDTQQNLRFGKLCEPTTPTKKYTEWLMAIHRKRVWMNAHKMTEHIYRYLNFFFVYILDGFSALPSSWRSACSQTKTWPFLDLFSLPCDTILTWVWGKLFLFKNLINFFFQSISRRKTHWIRYKKKIILFLCALVQQICHTFDFEETEFCVYIHWIYFNFFFVFKFYFEYFEPSDLTAQLGLLTTTTYHIDGMPCF
jgi:hypothetical protein